MDAQAEPARERMQLALHTKVALAVVIYCLSVSAVPIYNNKIFQGNLGVKKFPYPIATAFLQLGLVALTCFVFDIVGYVFVRRVRDNGVSWSFGPHLGYKLRHAAPVGILFGVKYGITNWGLQLVPIGTHLLLQSTDLVWTVLLARIANKEKLGLLEGFAAMVCSAGTVIISCKSTASLDVPWLGLGVNLLTPIFLALCITTLRAGTKELFRPDNRLQGKMTPMEFTALKLTFSSITALALAMGLENGIVDLDGKNRAAWWVALGGYSIAHGALLFGGAVFVLIFQVNITWLAGLTSATAVGIVGGMKVVPQWLLSALFTQSKFDSSWQHLVGAGLILLASIAYAFAASRPHMLVLNKHGWQWVPRAVHEQADEELLKQELHAKESREGQP